MNKTNKLLIFAKTIDGGTGTYVTNLLKLKAKFENNLIICLASLEKPKYMTRSNEEFYYLKNRDNSFGRYSLSSKHIVDFIHEFFWIKGIIQKEEPNIVISVDVNCNIINGLVKMFYKFNFKTIFTTHSDLDGNLDQRSTKILKLILNKVITFFYNKADLLITVSNQLSDSLISHYKLKQNVITIFNGLDLCMYNNKTYLQQNNIVLTVARLDSQKDYSTLLHAFKLVVKVINNAKLWIVGDGPLKAKLETYVNENELNQNIKFWGWQQNVKSFYMNSDIFVLSSRREGFPYALIEALSFGLPAICTDTPFGPSEILENGKYGFLVPMMGHIEIKDALINLLRNKEMYFKYSQLAFERSSMFTSERMINQYAVEIEKLL